MLVIAARRTDMHRHRGEIVERRDGRRRRPVTTSSRTPRSIGSAKATRSALLGVTVRLAASTSTRPETSASIILSRVNGSSATVSVSAPAPSVARGAPRTRGRTRRRSRAARGHHRRRKPARGAPPSARNPAPPYRRDRRSTGPPSLRPARPRRAPLRSAQQRRRPRAHAAPMHPLRPEHQRQKEKSCDAPCHIPPRPSDSQRSLASFQVDLGAPHLIKTRPNSRSAR